MKLRKECPHKMYDSHFIAGGGYGQSICPGGVFLPDDTLMALVNEQAEDEGLWFIARTAPEAYLQQELRRLHALIEDAFSVREAE